MTSTSELSPRLPGLKYLLLCNLTAVMLAAPCLAESEWPPAEAQDQIQTVNPEDLQPQSFESSPPAETPAVPPDATIEAPLENPAEAPPAAEIPAVVETTPEGIPPQFTENPIISVPEDPPPPPPEP